MAKCELPVSKCSGCGADIVWIKTEAGKNAPCDAKETSVVMHDGKLAAGHVNHFITCPAANKFRASER